MKLIAKVRGEKAWYEVGAFYSAEHPHIAYMGKGDAAWLYDSTGKNSGFVEVENIEQFKIHEQEELA
jgi:hypothetical protein